MTLIRGNSLILHFSTKKSHIQNLESLLTTLKERKNFQKIFSIIFWSFEKFYHTLDLLQKKQESISNRKTLRATSRIFKLNLGSEKIWKFGPKYQNCL